MPEPCRLSLLSSDNLFKFGAGVVLCLLLTSLRPFLIPIRLKEDEVSSATKKARASLSSLYENLSLWTTEKYESRWV